MNALQTVKKRMADVNVILATIMMKKDSVLSAHKMKFLMVTSVIVEVASLGINLVPV